MTYWEQKAKDSINRADRQVMNAIPQMVKSFESAKKDLSKEINAFYGRYAKDNKITLAEAQKILNFNELRQFRGNLREYEQLAKQSIGTYSLQVRNLSHKARITRLQALEFECDSILQRLYQEQKKIAESTTSKVYIEEYYHKLFDIEQYTGYQWHFAKIPTYAIEEMLKMPVNHSDIVTRLLRQDIDLEFKIKSMLTQMFTTGKPPQFFAEELGRAIGKIENGKGKGKKYEAYRVLYNEAGFALNQADLRAYEIDGIEEYEVLATLDTRTSEICRDMDGKHFPINNVTVGVNYPPFHENCRTTTVPYLKDLTTRMARENGKSKRVKDMPYREWEKLKGINES